MAEQAPMPPPYVFMRGRRSILAEVLFPKRVSYQREVLAALEEGLDEDAVKVYLSDTANLPSIMQEMSEYPQLFDPLQYERTAAVEPLIITIKHARQRIDTYRSHFYGWSMYAVEGMFVGRRRRLDEELTQVVRLIFRLESRYEREAKRRGCYDVLEALMRWVMSESGRFDHVLPWSATEKARFMELHGGTLPPHKQAFFDRRYEAITKEIKKWVDDTGLFVFGYLVRRFWMQAIAGGRREDEIWVANFFSMNLNIVKRQPQPRRRRTGNGTDGNAGTSTH